MIKPSERGASSLEGGRQKMGLPLGQAVAWKWDMTIMVEADRWQMVTQRGSHRQYKHPAKPGKVTIAATLRWMLGQRPSGHFRTGEIKGMKYLIIYKQTATGSHRAGAV